MKIAVVGAGIIGIPTAQRILQEYPNVELTIFAEKFSPNTTGDGAAGFWEPYSIGDTPNDLCLKWGAATYDHLLSIVRSGEGESRGVELVSGYYFFPEPREDPAWKDACLGFRRVTQREIDTFAPNTKDGIFFTSVMCCAKKYIPWIMKEITKNKKCTLVKKKLMDLSELAEYFDVIVNCAGLGSRDLVKDKGLIPYQGQLLTMQNTTEKMFWVISDGPQSTYVFPRGNEVIVGGCSLKGVWSEESNIEIQNEILERACKLVPSLKNAVIMNRWAGLRPVRPRGVRLERETMTFGNASVEVVHNYGHGGGGISLHWGCAKDAVRLVGECQREAISSNL